MSVDYLTWMELIISPGWCRLYLIWLESHNECGLSHLVGVGHYESALVREVVVEVRDDLDSNIRLPCARRPNHLQDTSHISDMSYVSDMLYVSYMSYDSDMSVTHHTIVTHHTTMTHHMTVTCHMTVTWYTTVTRHTAVTLSASDWSHLTLRFTVELPTVPQTTVWLAIHGRQIGFFHSHTNSQIVQLKIVKPQNGCYGVNKFIFL